MANDAKDRMVFLDDFHAIDKNVLICNNGNYGKHPIDPASALEFCPLCKTLLPACVSHESLKCGVIANEAASRHIIKSGSIFCPITRGDIQVGMGSACEICPNCGAYL